jgi:hypothetical protein
LTHAARGLRAGLVLAALATSGLALAALRPAL